MNPPPPPPESSLSLTLRYRFFVVVYSNSHPSQLSSNDTLLELQLEMVCGGDMYINRDRQTYMTHYCHWK